MLAFENLLEGKFLIRTPLSLPSDYPQFQCLCNLNLFILIYNIILYNLKN